MAGLPRSGSTLLSSILNQNPSIHSGASSPVVSCMHSVANILQKDELYKAYPKPEQASKMVFNLIEQFYSDIDRSVVLDKNRAWAAHVPLIETYIQQKAKIICPVRDIDEILASMIAMIRRNPTNKSSTGTNFIDAPLKKLNVMINDENRCNFIAGSQGILGNSLNAIFEGVRNGYLDRMLFVEYKDLTSTPEQSLRRIYEFLEEPYFAHDFDNIENINKENDLEVYGLEGMHEVRKVLKASAINPIDILPSTVLERCKGMDIWRRPEDMLSKKL